MKLGYYKKSIKDDMKHTLFISITLFILTLFTECINPGSKPTTIEIVDNNRHYYPILVGQELNIMFDIKNTGEHPLIVTDIITTCGCITMKGSSIKTIPAGKTGRLLLTYDSSKNIGYVKHYITLYGNILESNTREIVFDVNVVPNALYTKDYEELYQERKNKAGNIKDFVDGNENNKGYYID